MSQCRNVAISDSPPTPAPPGPAYWDAADGAWIVSLHADAFRVLREPGTIVVDGGREVGKFARRGHGFPNLAAAFGGMPIFQNPPQHGQSRAWLRQVIGRLSSQWTREALTRLADRRLDGLEVECVHDLRVEFADALPNAVIAEGLGLQPSDVRSLREEGSVIMEAWRPAVALRDYRRLEAAALRVFQRLAEARAPGQADETIETDAIRFFLVMASVETTSAFIGNAVHLLAHDASLQSRLRHEPELMSDFIEEALRWCGPLKALSPRLAPRDLELEGAHVPAGSPIMIRGDRAHRDPAVFPDPDRFLLERPQRQIIAFGSGPHICPGATLARLESSVAISRLLARFQLSPAEGARLRVSRAFRQWDSLPVRLDPL